MQLLLFIPVAKDTYILCSNFLIKALFSLKFLTFLAIIVALFGKLFRDRLLKPQIEVSFDSNSDRCFRNATVLKDIIQEFPYCLDTKRQYFRLKVANKGRSTAKNVRAIIDVYYEGKEEAERFEPNALKWISGMEKIDIATDETTYVNLLSQVIEIDKILGTFFPIRFEIANTVPRGLAWDRISKIYIIKLIMHGDNLKAKTYWLKFTPDPKDILKIGKLEFIK